MTEFTISDLRKVIETIHLSDLEFNLKHTSWLGLVLVSDNMEFKKATEKFSRYLDQLDKATQVIYIHDILRHILITMEDQITALTEIEASFNKINDIHNADVCKQYRALTNNFIMQIEIAKIKLLTSSLDSLISN